MCRSRYHGLLHATTAHNDTSTPQALQTQLKRDKYSYKSSDGRPKATMEDVFRPDRCMTENSPWQFSWQKNERNLTFDDPLKVHLIKGFAANELGIDGEVRLNHLFI